MNDDKSSLEDEMHLSPDLIQALPAKEKKGRGILKDIKYVILIVIGILIFRSTCLEPFKIPSGSMIPTLMIGDFILANKMSYGLKVPFSDWELWGRDGPIYIFGSSMPQRGDIVVFKYPRDKSMNFIKRVVGVPGDTVEIRDKMLYINNQQVGVREIDGKEIMKRIDKKFKDLNLKFYESTTGAYKHIIQIDKDNFFRTEFSPTIIPPGMFFVLGDNRDFSHDSRFWGFVPMENVKGKALLVWLSLKFANDGEDSSFEFRLSRIGKMLHKKNTTRPR